MREFCKGFMVCLLVIYLFIMLLSYWCFIDRYCKMIDLLVFFKCKILIDILVV